MRDGPIFDCPGGDDFTKLAADQLLPIVGRYGFTIITEDSQRLRFENDKVWLALSYHERDCEVALTFGRNGSSCEPMIQTWAASLATGLPIRPSTLGIWFASSPKG